MDSSRYYHFSAKKEIYPLARSCRISFLNPKKDIETYTNIVSAAVNQHLLLSTFSKEGPLKCSGLPITQYDSDSISANFSAAFELIQQQAEVHTTPFNSTQAFIYALFKNSTHNIFLYIDTNFNLHLP